MKQMTLGGGSAPVSSWLTKCPHCVPCKKCNGNPRPLCRECGGTGECSCLCGDIHECVVCEGDGLVDSRTGLPPRKIGVPPHE